RDPDALRYVVVGSAAALPKTIDARTTAEDGATTGELRGVATEPVPCPPGVDPARRCVTTPPLRIAGEAVDARHPLVAHRSLVGELGGALHLTAPGARALLSLPIGGPRYTRIGPVERLRARLRVLLVRLRPGGAPPVGRDDAEALRVARTAVARANALWGGCGVSFGPPAEAAISLVDPPPAHLLVVGCDHGLPASGGRIRFRVAGRSIDVPVAPGATPRGAARRLAAALRRAGLTVRLSDNPPGGAAAMGSTDLSVRSAAGRLVSVEPPRSGPVSTDATLSVCVGQVHLDDGVEHFGDVDAVVGTVEERALVKAFDDGDPSTIEVYVVPGFGRGGRIGESFIFSDGGAIRNTVLVDGAGLVADRASFALAHELGHVLLDDPGHTDDYGRDTPTRLMDADAVTGTAFGPTRISLTECADVVERNGPAAAVPLLERWPLRRPASGRGAAR
ncbi:MAG: hypothetical protein JRI23_13435, partial [Deltaproteobacteria bacterium]|nr:hypothetical protein [Deltaproteobacteria bacterium]MBW2532727.1 hypothetical protein [Deltaproteobacteria bacterium]